MTLIEDLFGQSVVEVHQQIAAGLIPPGLAEGLQVQAGATALEVQRTYRLNRAGCHQHPSGIPISSFDDDEAGERMIAGRHIACVRFSLISLCVRGAQADWYARQERPGAP